MSTKWRSMHLFRDTASIQASHTKALVSELGELLDRIMEELNEYGGLDLSELVHIIVIEPNDALTDVDTELGFSLLDRPWDVVESHPCWYAITVIVSDDGFGWVIYVPKHASTDATLLEMCASYCQESMP